MSRIYISSSWNNKIHTYLVMLLRQQGHKVYDFKNLNNNQDGHSIIEDIIKSLRLESAYKQGILSPEDNDKILSDKKVVKCYSEHLKAIQDADTCILLLPCGKSSHIEAGYLAGIGKRVFVYDTNTHVSPELMYLTLNGYFHNIDDLINAINEPVPGVCSVCGCTQTNPCYHPDKGYCYWVTPSLCSHCASVEQGGLGIYDDSKTKHCINDKSDAYK